jgi:hypothetical protein
MLYQLHKIPNVDENMLAFKVNLKLSTIETAGTENIYNPA